MDLCVVLKLCVPQYVKCNSHTLGLHCLYWPFPALFHKPSCISLRVIFKLAINRFVYKIIFIS